MFNRLLARKFSSFTKASLPSLPYGYGDLAPVISAEIMELHHGKHHQKYVDQYNLNVEKLQAALAKGDHKLASDTAKNVRFNGGGHVNHSLYWENLAPVNKAGGDMPSKTSPIGKSIIQHWGSFDSFLDNFNTKAEEVQGSGWVWLAYDPKTKGLSIQKTMDQNILSGEGLGEPLLTVDVWEHAYYLQYKNQKPNYVKKIWEIMNWKVVEKRFDTACQMKC